MVCEPLSVQVPDGIYRDSWFVQPNLNRSLNGAQERLIKSAFGLLLPLRGCVALRIARDGMYADFAGAKICPCPNSAVGIVCEPLSVQVPVGVYRDSWFVQPNLNRSLNGAQERT